MSKILVCAYQLSPYRGSEYSVAWNYVVNMSKYHELVVFYGDSGKCMGDVSEMQEYWKKNPLPNVRLIPVLPTRKVKMLNLLNTQNIWVYSFYFAFQAWHKLVYKQAVSLLKKEDFDLVHYVGPIGYREPGYLWKLDLPFVWGPIGGFNNVPLCLMKAFPLSGKIKLGLRSVLNFFQMYMSRRVYQAVRKSACLLAATSYNGQIIKQIYHKDPIVLPENSIHTSIESVNLSKYESFSVIKLVWIGSLVAGKALILLLKALSGLTDKNRFELHVVGDGPLKSQLQQYAHQLQIDTRIIWYGSVDRTQVYDILKMAHLHVITSASEATTTVLFEAMSMGVPTMTLDHCGMHDVVTETCGIKIPVTCYDEIIHCLCLELEVLSQDPVRLIELANGTIERAKQYTWEARVGLLNCIYQEVLAQNK